MQPRLKGHPENYVTIRLKAQADIIKQWNILKCLLLVIVSCAALAKDNCFLSTVNGPFKERSINTQNKQ